MAAVSDLHLWPAAPPARAGEPDWYGALKRAVDQLAYVKENANGAGGDVPLVYAGDVFDRWNAPAEVVNWAIKHLPTGYAVPGQHDLPYHRYGDLRKSAYWTLVLAGTLRDLKPGRPCPAGSVVLHGFPWGEPVCPAADDAPEGAASLAQHVAVVHAYVWVPGASYPDAPARSRAKAQAPQLKGYAAAFYGDNHKPFHYDAGGCQLVNCGGFMRRKADDSHHPRISLLHEGGAVSYVYLDLSGESFSPTPANAIPAKDAANFDVFIESLQTLRQTAHDYRGALMEHMDREGVPRGVREMILHALGEGRAKRDGR